MSQKSQQVSGDLGNTNPNPHAGSTRKRARRFCFTLNNWNQIEYDSMSQYFESNGCFYIVGKEVGAEGTPHLQGYVEFKNQKDMTALKKINNRAHWEVAKGTRDQNITYCSKDQQYETNLKVKLDKRQMLLKQEYGENIVWKPWQQEVLDIMKTKPDRRTVHWFWEDIGNVGKSFIAMYLGLKYDCIICDGKKDNVFNQIKIWDEKNPDKIAPDLIICDVPRSYHDSQVSYGCIEKIKDGQLYSGKYEGGQIYIGKVHVICFSNQEPEYDKLSEDRWKVVKITN